MTLISADTAVTRGKTLKFTAAITHANVANKKVWDTDEVHALCAIAKDGLMTGVLSGCSLQRGVR